MRTAGARPNGDSRFLCRGRGPTTGRGACSNRHSGGTVTNRHRYISGRRQTEPEHQAWSNCGPNHSLVSRPIGSLPEGHGGARIRGGGAAAAVGRGVTYTLRRLKRDRPDLLKRIVSGELSANAAAVEVDFARGRARWSRCKNCGSGSARPNGGRIGSGFRADRSCRLHLCPVTLRQDRRGGACAKVGSPPVPQES